MRAISGAISSAGSAGVDRIVIAALPGDRLGDYLGQLRSGDPLIVVAVDGDDVMIVSMTVVPMRKPSLPRPGGESR